ncbi:hypothetical protein DSO57_1010683 [Entomophthora muscae]|uniref:Uncharacterized protein n=1 Tax=Entomophthora muscae TaxID=34485 RepID=A0ACC2SJJ0_9FUNG|nr:hypothetical protein DSO57_1010683 [Entomophthora muscae]
MPDPVRTFRFPNLELNLPKRTKSVNCPELFKPLNIPNNLPPTIDTWSYSQVIQFIVHVLSLPKALENDIRDFILDKRINGKRLANLGEDELAKLGFNKLWCYNLASAIEDLTFKGIIRDSSIHLHSSSSDSKPRKKRSQLTNSTFEK